MQKFVSYPHFNAFLLKAALTGMFSETQFTKQNKRNFQTGEINGDLSPGPNGKRLQPSVLSTALSGERNTTKMYLAAPLLAFTPHFGC
jgi:hypothetical protein